MKEARVQGAVILEEPREVRRDSEGQPSARSCPGSPLRVGLIGAGKMGMHHLKAIKALPHATVVGVADPAASREALDALLPAEAEIVATAAELLNRIKPDVVHIVTPPGSHASLAKLAIEAGCHVYLEKPFTPTSGEAEEILALAAARGVKVCAGHQVLFEAPARAALAELPTIGRVVHIESHFSFKMVRRTITAVEQIKDILPHAVYPVVEQLQAATGLDTPLELAGISVDAKGDAYALIRQGSVTAIVMVTINGRPVEQYQQIIGTNGSLRADYIGGTLIRLIGPGAGPGVLLTPFRRSWQTITGTTRGIVRLVKRLGASYPGLTALVGAFYESIRHDTAPPQTTQAIIETVRICERIGTELDLAEADQERAARVRLEQAEAALPPLRAGVAGILVTGATGLLGRRVAEELRWAGFPVRAIARRVPPYSKRVPGVEYARADLGAGIDPVAFAGIGTVVHCAAETAGGKAEHQRNSIDATRHLIEAAAQAGVRRIVHISSIGILKTSREVGHPLDEHTPIDSGTLRRGPYVWGKAESEVVAQQLAEGLGLDLKIVRPGPLVDYAAFQTPGRLGREIGPFYVAIGPRRGALSVCDVSTAARVLRRYAEEFDSAPPVLNLLEAPAPSRRDLLARFLAGRPDLRVFWVPAWILRAASGPLKLVQRIALKSKQPVDVAAAFASEQYRTDLAQTTIGQAGPSVVGQT
jgi:predicted dehydrogenase/nucleoside-diphosphate-sugar epimerase